MSGRRHQVRLQPASRAWAARRVGGDFVGALRLVVPELAPIFAAKKLNVVGAAHGDDVFCGAGLVDGRVGGAEVSGGKNNHHPRVSGGGEGGAYGWGVGSR